jgi:hypothetical protein
MRNSPLILEVKSWGCFLGVGRSLAWWEFKIQNLKIQNPKSKIQNPKSKIQNPKSKIQNPKLNNA